VIAVGTARLAQQTRHHRILDNGFSFHRSEWMDGGRDPALSPTIFLVEQPPHSVLHPHFHTQNQFQVFKEGSGTLGRHSVGPGSVHYAGAHTGYGPLAAGPEGLSYFTLRAAYETGAHFLPADRDQLRRGPKRHAHGPSHESADTATLRALQGTTRTQLIAPDPDGMDAFSLLVPAGSAVELPPATGSGQFQLVLAGEYVAPQGSLGRWESRFLSCGEDTAGCRAGATGLHLLVLRMPLTASDYERRNDPRDFSCISAA